MTQHVPDGGVDGPRGPIVRTDCLRRVSSAWKGGIMMRERGRRPLKAARMTGGFYSEVPTGTGARPVTGRWGEGLGRLETSQDLNASPHRVLFSIYLLDPRLKISQPVHVDSQPARDPLKGNIGRKQGCTLLGQLHPSSSMAKRKGDLGRGG